MARSCVSWPMPSSRAVLTWERSDSCAEFYGDVLAVATGLHHLKITLLTVVAAQQEQEAPVALHRGHCNIALAFVLVCRPCICNIVRARTSTRPLRYSRPWVWGVQDSGSQSLVNQIQKLCSSTLLSCCIRLVITFSPQIMYVYALRSPDLYDRGSSYPKQIWICLNTLEKKYP